MSSRSLRAATGLVALLLAGCHQIYNDITDFRMARRVNREASHVWRVCSYAYEDQVYHLDDFRDGFRAGYAQVLGGGDVCPPTLPPKKYWSIRYQSQEGRERIDAWFSGHETGVATALQDGVQDEVRIPLSPYRRAQLQGNGGCPSCFPPMITEPADQYETVPPTPADEGVTGRFPLEDEMPVAEAEDAVFEEEPVPEEIELDAEMEAEFEEAVTPVEYRSETDVVDQE